MSSIDHGRGVAGWIEATTVGDAVARAGSTWSHDALVFPDERASYPELATRTTQMARRLVGLEVGPGDKVGLLMPPGVDYLALLFAAASIGAAAVPINARFKAHELNHVVTHSRMRTLVTSRDAPDLAQVHDRIEQALPGLRESNGSALHLDVAPDLQHVLSLGKDPVPAPYLDREAFIALGHDVSDERMEALRYRVALRDPAVVMYTSGTTAAPKGALLPHEGLVRKGVTVSRTRLDLSPDDRVWTPLPLYHIGGVAFAVTCVVSGATYVHAGNFDPGVSVRQLGEERCTLALPAFETIWLQVLDHPDLPSTDLSALRLVFNVGVPERLAEMQQRLPHAIQVSGFGATESCSFVSIGQPWDDLDTRVGTCGFPLIDVDLRIVDPDTGRELGPYERGEIQFRGPCTLTSYLHDEQKTASVIDEGGWFRSGDLGLLDEDGRLVFVSRLKDMLKVGGENVAAAEVEGYLLRHPAVLLAQVVSAPDARYDEVPTAFVQLRPGETATEDELIEFCLGNIATFKVPRYVRFVDEWPMSGTKIKKHVLRDQIRAELDQAGISQAPKLTSRSLDPA